MKIAALLTTLSFLSTEAYGQNGGTSCESAVNLPAFGGSFTADTRNAPNWMGSFGPLVSPSNDVAYTFIASTNPDYPLSFNPSAASYQFAVYLIPNCADSGAEPTPIGATATLNRPITNENLSTPLVAGQRYYLAVTGSAAGGATANGTVTFSTFVPVELKAFEVR